MYNINFNYQKLSKWPVLLIISLIMTLSSIGKGKDKEKKDPNAPVSITGEVIRTKVKATTLYKIGNTTVARGSEKHVSQHVGKIVTALCIIKRERIVRIQSLKVEENTSVSSVVPLTKLQDLYKQDRSSTIKKYRNINHTYTATATGIKSFSSSAYRISLHRNLGEIIIDKVELPRELNKLLWSGKSKNITFTGSWLSDSMGKMVFKKITSIN